ncbi:MAG: ATP-binding protein [Acidobacteriota bacterium]|jgi:nitrogen fixation/metabolism regulation signal transduction histidine kinase
MSLRTKLITYLVAIHAALGAIALLALRDRPLWLLAAEGLFLVSITLGVLLVRAFFVPLRLIRTGAELVAEGDFTSTFRPVGQAEMDALIRVYNRMISRLREERLRVQEQDRFLMDLLDASPAGVLTLDFDGRIDLVNPAAAEIWGRPADELRGAELEALDGTLGPALAGLAVGDSRVVAEGGRRFKASRAAYYDRGFARSFFVLQELTEELRRSERDAYEKLIRMISHEVNNSVGAVSSLLESAAELVAEGGGASGAEMRGGRPDRVVEALTVAGARLGRLREFVNGYADVVRLPEPERRPCDVATLLDEILILLGPELARRRIEHRWTEREPVPEISLDRNQMEQVLVNVLKNAMEAIGEDGWIELALTRETLTIRDTGPGLAPEVRERLFTPFFSTKRDGRGLGLTLAHEVLGRHGFDHALRNRPEGGAELVIRF